ncbi:DUF6879 family protein [Sphaerisporangium sp. NPDC051017]|uniref:DUF6879 family protein n=1 Tax=Sphaerisporangium sp. NPDC051017 TaxID=3154636 RepID=UPI00342C3E82
MHQADRRLYDDIRSRGIEYSRIRLVQEPLTAYLDYELLAYRIRANLGEVIGVVRCDSALNLPNEDFFDWTISKP